MCVGVTNVYTDAGPHVCPVVTGDRRVYAITEGVPQISRVVTDAWMQSLKEDPKLVE